MTIEEMQKTVNTLKQTSYDSANDDYMSNIDYQVIDFDKVKDKYLKSLDGGPCQKCLSNDALFQVGDQWYFIEFKNGVITIQIDDEIKTKIYDSLLIFLEIIDEHIDYSREKVNYILVFNSDYIDRPNYSRNFKRDEYRRYFEQIDCIDYRADLLHSMERLSGEFGKPQFGLGRLKKFIFKDVKTLPKRVFDEYIKEVLTSG